MKEVLSTLNQFKKESISQLRILTSNYRRKKMAWFWKRKNNRSIYRYSIGEKLAYYQRQLNSDDPKKRKWARESINRLEKEINKFGNVFIVRDKEFNPNANNKKSRRIIGVGIKNGSIESIPVYRNNSLIVLSNFDRNRVVNINKKKRIPLDRVYENRTFKKNNNDYLNQKEKQLLNKKIKEK